MPEEPGWQKRPSRQAHGDSPPLMQSIPNNARKLSALEEVGPLGPPVPPARIRTSCPRGQADAGTQKRRSGEAQQTRLGQVTEVDANSGRSCGQHAPLRGCDRKGFHFFAIPPTAHSPV